jgi:hypothetical protein
MVNGRQLRWFGHKIRMESNRKPRELWERRVWCAVKRKTKDRMGGACMEGDEEIGKTL